MAHATDIWSAANSAVDHENIYDLKFHIEQLIIRERTGYHSIWHGPIFHLYLSNQIR